MRIRITALSSKYLPNSSSTCTKGNIGGYMFRPSLVLACYFLPYLRLIDLFRDKHINGAENKDWGRGAWMLNGKHEDGTMLLGHAQLMDFFNNTCKIRISKQELCICCCSNQDYRRSQNCRSHNFRQPFYMKQHSGRCCRIVGHPGIYV